MPREHSATLAFNRGLLSQFALARVDISRYKMAAAVMTNWMARVLGSMMLRPGTQYLTPTYENHQAKTIPFVFAATDLARIELTQDILRVLVNDTPIVRPLVTAAVTNGNFVGSLAGWTNSSDPGCTVTWEAAGEVAFVGTGTSNAILDQEVNVNEEGTEHALRIIVTRGPFIFRCGLTQGDDTYINETTLYTGVHSLSFTPNQGTFWIRFQNPNPAQSLLASCNVEPAGVMTIPAPWQTADFPNLRWAQSADVIYVGCSGYQQMMVQRRALHGWSLVQYTGLNGPFRPINATQTTIAASAIDGDITLTASQPLFKAGQVGALFSLASIGQQVSAALSAGSTYTSPIRVNGVGSQRQFSIVIGGTFSGTMHLQYSVAAPGTWIDAGPTYGLPGTATYTDGLDNQVIYYRIGFDPGGYTSGTADVTMTFASGSITGIVQVTGFTNNENVNARVLTSLGGTAATSLWSEGAWSPFRGYPETCCLFQGRLWWFGSSIFGSISDDYENFDATVLGDSAPIIGQLDAGPVENMVWALALQQLVVGTASGETSCRSTYLGDPVTVTNFNVLMSSTQGSANVPALVMDRSGIFVQVSTQRVFELNLDIYTYAYQSTELTLLVPDLSNVGIVQMVIQRKPDTRLHCLRADGTVAIMVYDAAENVSCWFVIEAAANGFVEDMSVLPGVGEDQVYYTVRRTMAGATVRYHEKFAQETECYGLPVAKCLDAHTVHGPAAPTATLTAVVPPQLAGQTVSVWGWNTINPYVDGNGNEPGLDLGTYVVDSAGTIQGLTFEGAAYPVTNAIVGLPYTAQWQSMKEAFAAGMGTPLNQKKRIDSVGLLLSNTHARGIQIGPDFEHLWDLPQADLPTIGSQDGAQPDLNAILVDYDWPMSAFGDIWTTDSRVCMQAASPRPCTALAFTASMTTNG